MSVRYSQQENDVMVGGFQRGLNDQQIVERINHLQNNIDLGVVRTVPGIHSRRRSLGLLRRERKEHVASNHCNSDMLFQDAMRHAICLGIEHVREGVFHDPTPFVGRLIHPEPVFSGCSSAAGLCADVGDKRAAFEPV